MFEAKLDEAALLKKIVESIKDLTTDVNFDTSGTGNFKQSFVIYVFRNLYASYGCFSRCTGFP